METPGNLCYETQFYASQNVSSTLHSSFPVAFQSLTGPVLVRSHTLFSILIVTPRPRVQRIRLVQGTAGTWHLTANRECAARPFPCKQRFCVHTRMMWLTGPLLFAVPPPMPLPQKQIFLQLRGKKMGVQDLLSSSAGRDGEDQALVRQLLEKNEKRDCNFRVEFSATGKTGSEEKRRLDVWAIQKESGKEFHCFSEGATDRQLRREMVDKWSKLRPDDASEDWKSK